MGYRYCLWFAELEELAIVECSKFEPRQDRSGSGDEDRLISDVAFHFALLKMKNLRLLTVTNGFNVSQCFFLYILFDVYAILT